MSEDPEKRGQSPFSTGKPEGDAEIEPGRGEPPPEFDTPRSGADETRFGENRPDRGAGPASEPPGSESSWSEPQPGSRWNEPPSGSASAEPGRASAEPGAASGESGAASGESGSARSEPRRAGERDRAALDANLKSKHTWLRLLFIVFFAILFGIAEFVVTVAVLIQFVWTLFNGEPNERLRELGRSIGRYAEQIIRYLTYDTDERPFPIDLDWPSGRADEL